MPPTIFCDFLHLDPFDKGEGKNQILSKGLIL
jgi:hypothetical protein